MFVVCSPCWVEWRAVGEVGLSTRWVWSGNVIVFAVDMGGPVWGVLKICEVRWCARPRSAGRFKYSQVVAFTYSSARNVAYHNDYREESRTCRLGFSYRWPCWILHFATSGPAACRSSCINLRIYCVVLCCGLLVRISGYRSRGPGSIPGTTRFYFLRSSGCGTGSTRSREYNWKATWKKK
jgi:hypothetical protein